MKACWIYTLARLGLFAATYLVVWFVVGLWLESNDIVNIWVLLISLIVSSILSLVLLGALREKFALVLQDRADALNARIEESRRAEDVD